MLAARPAQGKSAFALATAVRMQVPTLYLCPDTTARTQWIRLMAMSEEDRLAYVDKYGVDLVLDEIRD